MQNTKHKLFTKIAIAAETANEIPQATRLSRQLTLSISPIDTIEFPILLTVTSTHLELRWLEEPTTKPLFVDFLGLTLQHRTRYGGGAKQLLCRAIGIKPNYKPNVIDATAGLGQDAFILATQGCNVTLFERSTIIAALLQDGITRAQSCDTFHNLKLKLIVGNAIALLTNIKPTNYPDVIYLDPMYPHRTKSALAKKSMRLLRQIVGEDEDSPELLKTALQRAQKRVVVKRPRLAPPIEGPAPHLKMVGKSSRFDIYLTHQ